MSGDYSRLTFDPARNYAAVRMQQGRVSLDSDWNEQADLLDRRLRAAIVDMFGRIHVASPGAFAIAADAGGLSIGRGRIYVDGLLVENHGAGQLVWDPVLAEQYGAAAVPYAQQPYLPVPPALPAQGGPYLVYLDVWEREVTAVENPELLEPALGGPDTAGRSQTVWQVKILMDAAASSHDPLKSAAFAPSSGRLSMQTGPDGYLGLDNKLYRVEIHDSGTPGNATFKWSRDNGSVAARIRSGAEFRLVLDRRPDVTQFSDGDRIEITDDQRELGGHAGEMRRIAHLEQDTITLTRPLSGALPGANARLRRWDQQGKVGDGAGHVYVDLDAKDAKGVIPVPPAGRVVVLENGISVSFDLAPGSGAFRAGDYWVTPARTDIRSIGRLKDAPPRGIHHHYAELALFTTPHGVTDRRKKA